MTDNRQDINYVRAEVQESKQELALAQNAGDLAQVDFHRKRLLQLESQLSCLHEQQTILLRSSQQILPVQSLTSIAALKDRQVHQPPLLDANEQAADQVVDSLQGHGCGWLKVSQAETQSFHELQQFTVPGSCFDEAGDLLRDKRLLHYTTGRPNSSLPSAMCAAANKVANPQAGKLIDVKLPEGYMLVLTGYTLEHVTCGIFKAAPHNVEMSDPAIQRLSFAYKLRCPIDGAVTQYNNLSANSKQLDQKHMKGTTVEALMTQFHEYRWSINHAGKDLVELGLSPEWQHAVNEWRSTRHSVDDEWIWLRLISTMGWQRPDRQLNCKTGSGRIFPLMIHHTWTVAGLESILEILHQSSRFYAHYICGSPIYIASHLGRAEYTERHTVQHTPSGRQVDGRLKFEIHCLQCLCVGDTHLLTLASRPGCSYKRLNDANSLIGWLWLVGSSWHICLHLYLLTRCAATADV